MALRPVPLSILGGSLASLLLRSVEDRLPAFPLSPDCLVPELPDFLHWPSLLLGIGIGLLLGPVIDVVYLLRVWWSALVRERAAALRLRPAPLYRTL